MTTTMDQPLSKVMHLDDVVRGYAQAAAVVDGIGRGTTVLLSGSARTIAVGREVPVKVNTNIGISKETPYELERDKLVRLAGLHYRPDLMMDHTIDRNRRDFWKEIVRTFDGAVGTLPQYTAYRARTGLAVKALLDRIEEMLDGGVAFMTLHFTADADLYEVARKTRPIAVTSRGGGLALRDLLRWPKSENAFRAGMGEIVRLFRKYDAAVSVGTTFRPPDIFSALDEVHLMETERQIEIVRFLRDNGVKVIMEGVGHVPLDRISEYADLIDRAGCPFMPLGPIVTDSAIGFDHVASAIGGAFMAYAGAANVLNSVTSEEHTGGVPTVEAVLDGLKAARVAAHSVNLTKFPLVSQLDRLTIRQRGAQVSCVVSGGLFAATVDDPRRGCTRCSFECPIILAPSAQFV